MANPNAASNSHTREELLAVVELCRKARLVPELQTLMRSASMVNHERKALNMLASIDRRSRPPKEESPQ